MRTDPGVNHRLFTWACFGLVAAAVIYLLSEHANHVKDFLPFALVLACPLMHLFMHHGHDHGEHHDERTPADPPAGEGHPHRSA